MESVRKELKLISVIGLFVSEILQTNPKFCFWLLTKVGVILDMAVLIIIVFY